LEYPSRFLLKRLYWLQGPQLGHGGIDLVPSQDRSAPVPPPHITPDGNPESLSNFLAQHPTPPTINTETTSDRGNPRESNITMHVDASPSGQSSSKLLPRETGHDIGMGSPVPLSSEAVGVITRLRNMKVRQQLLSHQYFES